jgi:DNA polymerase I-like protein with 3'-5' exonuclease and polymerase domains
MDLHDLYLHTERNGFEFDELANSRLLQKYIAWCEKLRFERWQICQQHINVNSWKQVDVMLYEVMGVPRRQGTGEEVLTGLLNIVKKKDQKEMINNILEERRVNKTISTYLLPVRDFDGKIRTSFYPCLETGRTSTNLMEPPVRPWELFRDPEDNKAKKKAFGSAFQVLTKHGDVGGDIREQYIPRKGHVLVNIDSNQAEARVIARLANDEKMLKLYDTNDVHALTASWFLGGDEAQWSKKVLGYECPQRFLGKTLRHAGHLGAKKKRAATEVNTSARKYHIDISVNEAFTEKALIIFHKKSPNIQGVFHAEIINAIGRNRVLIASLPYGIEAKFGGRRTFYERWGDELFRQAFSYLPQRAISDNTKAAAIRIRKIIREIRLIVESHDSLTYEVPEFMVDEWAGIFKSEMERPIRFENCSLSRADLVIPSEIEIGYNYKDFNKYRRKIA